MNMTDHDHQSYYEYGSGDYRASGGITRRSFLDRASLLTAAGMAAAYGPGFGAAQCMGAGCARHGHTAGAEPLRLFADHRPAGDQVAEQRARRRLGGAEHGVVRVHAR